MTIVGDNNTIGSDHDSVDTAATCRMEYFEGQCQIGEKKNCSNDYVAGGFINNRLSLEAKRQDELKSQSIVNALNHFILQAGNIYKGNKLSTLEETRLRHAANEAGLSINVVDVLIEQTADQNAIVDYCTTSDDVFARKIKEDPQLSRILLRNEQNNQGRGDGLNVSHSVWRIFMHKIIKQFLKEQNMQLADIIEKSSHTRRLYEETMSFGPDQNKFDTSRLPRDYSEERKHVFIPEAEVKQARIAASEAMVKSQQCKNPYVYDLVNRNPMQGHCELPPLIPHQKKKNPDSRDDDLSMMPCSTERELVDPVVDPTDDLCAIPYGNNQDVPTTRIGKFLEINKSRGNLSDLPGLRDGNSRLVPWEIERASFIERIQMNTIRPSGLDIADDLDDIPCPPEPNISSIRVESFPDINNNSSKTLSKIPIEQKILPSLKGIDGEKNDKELRGSPCTPKREVLQTITKSNILERNTASAVKRRIAMYEKGPASPHLNRDSAQTKIGKLEQDSFSSGSVLQARAIFERNDEQSQTDIELSISPQPKPSGNVLQVRAIFENKKKQLPTDVELSKSPQPKPNGNVLQARSIFEKEDQHPQNDVELSTSAQPINDLLRTKIVKLEPSANVLQARAIFETKDQQPQDALELDRKRKKKNTKHDFATWTQTEQENSSSYTQKGSENRVDRTNIEKIDNSMEYLKVVENRSFFEDDVIDDERSTKLRQVSHYRERHLSSGGTVGYETRILDVKEEIKVGIQQVLVNDMQVSEYNLQQRSVKKRNQLKLNDTNSTWVYGGDDVFDTNKKSDGTILPFDQNFKLKPTNASESNNQEAYQREMYDGNDGCDDFDINFPLDKTPIFSSVHISEKARPVEVHDGDDGSDENDASEDVCHRASLPFDQNAELNSTDEAESTVQEYGPVADHVSDNSYFDQSEEKSEDSQRENPNRLNARISETAEFTFHPTISKQLLVEDGRQSQQRSFESDVLHKVRNSRNGLEIPSFRQVFEHDKSNFEHNEILAVDDVVYNDIHDILTYVKSASDDSNRIIIPPLQRPQGKKSDMVQENAPSPLSECQQYTKKEDCDKVASHTMFAYSYDSPESFNENSWAEFESNNGFRDQRATQLQRQDNSDYDDSAGSENHAIVDLNMDESAEILNYRLEEKTLERNVWANFKSESVFHHRCQESSASLGCLDNIERIQNAKHDNISSETTQHISIAAKERTEEDSNRVKKAPAPPSTNTSKTWKEYPKGPNDKDFVPFTFNPFPNHSMHEEPNTTSKSVLKIGKRSFVDNMKDMRNCRISHTTFHTTPSVESSQSKIEEKISSRGPNKERTIIDDKLLSEPTPTSISFNDAKTLKSKRLEADTSLHEGNKSIVSEPKEFFASLLLSNSSSIHGEPSRDACTMHDHKGGTFSNEEMDQISSQRFHQIETNFGREDQGDNCWEFFSSNFEAEGREDDRGAGASRNKGALNEIHKSDEDGKQIESIHSLSSFNEFNEVTKDQQDSLHHARGFRGTTDFHSEHQPSGLVEKKTANYLEPENRFRENFTQVEIREVSKDLCSSRSSTVAMCLQSSSGNISSRNSSDLENGDDCSEETFDKFVNSISPAYEYAREASERRPHPKKDLSNEDIPADSMNESDVTGSFGKTIDHVVPSVPPRNEQRIYSITNNPDQSNEPAPANKFSTTYPLSRKDNTTKLEKQDNCIALIDSNSILEHNQGIKTFLEQRGDLPEECVEENRHSPEHRIHAGNLKHMNDMSEERNHLEALSVFLTTYRHDEEQKGYTSGGGRVNAHQAINNTIEHQDHLDVQNSERGNSRRDDPTLEWPDIIPGKVNVASTGLDENVSTNFSETDIVDTVVSNADEGNNEDVESDEISWPADDENTNARGSFSSNVSAELRIDLSTNQEDNSRTQLKAQRIHHRKSLDSINDDVTKDKYSERASNSTECPRHQKIYRHQENRLHTGPIVKVLDRPLLDLDDSEECFDAIEVERQKSNDSGYLEPAESRTTFTSNSRIYQADLKPDPLPDPSPKGSRKLSPKGSRRLSYATLGSKNATEVPEGATEEELKLLNHFIEVASSNFGGNILSADSESRVRLAALKVGLTSKFVDQLLNQTMSKEKDDPSSRLSFIPSQPSSGLEQKPFNDRDTKHLQNDYNTYQHDRSNYVVNDYGDNGTNDGIDYYSRRTVKERRRYERPAEDCNVWDSLGKSLGLIANMTARVCGVEYHSRNRDDASSIVSAISWEEDNTGRRRRSERSRESGYERAEHFVAPNHPADQHRERTTQQRVTFASNFEEEEEAKGQESDTIQNDANSTSTPPRPKITQLV